MPQDNSGRELKQLFKDIDTSYTKGEKRNLIADFKRLLKITNVTYEAEYRQRGLAKLPTIIASNHYVRPLFVRKSLFTTLDSMITSAIITLSLSKLTKNKITWVVKNNIRGDLLFYDNIISKTQLTAISCYDFIGDSNGYPFGAYQKWLEYLKAGYYIALYPEGKISRVLQNQKDGFEKKLKHLLTEKLKFQILPVSIWSHGDYFKVTFGKVIKPNCSPDKIAHETMINIALGLPSQLRGDYAKSVGEYGRSSNLNFGNYR